METVKRTQNHLVLGYIEKHGSITALDAMLDLGIMRLASRISDLKRMGYLFDSAFVTVKNRRGEDCRVKSYRLRESGVLCADYND